MKIYHCRDAGFDCKVEIRGEDEDEILRLATIHAFELHGLEPSEQMRRDIQRLIRDEKPTQPDDVEVNR